MAGLLSALIIGSNAMTVSAGVSYAGVVNTIFESDNFKGYWYGGITPVAGPNELASQQDRGTWSVTGYFYKANSSADSSGTYDWYEVEIRLKWNTTVHGYYDNRGYLAVVPTATTVSNGYIKAWQASPSKAGSTCSQVTWNLGVTNGFLSTGIGIPIKICPGATVTRDGATSTGGWRWTTPDVTKTPLWSEFVEVKVPQGKKPAFNVKVIYPKYSVYYDYTNQRATYSRSWREVSVLLSATSP